MCKVKTQFGHLSEQRGYFIPMHTDRRTLQCSDSFSVLRFSDQGWGPLTPHSPYNDSPSYSPLFYASDRASASSVRPQVGPRVRCLLLSYWGLGWSRVRCSVVYYYVTSGTPRCISITIFPLFRCRPCYGVQPSPLYQGPSVI